MSASIYLRGGQPLVVSGTAKASPTALEQHWPWTKGSSNWLYFQNLDPSSQITLYFHQEDADAEINGVIVPAGLGTPGNPLSLPIEAGCFWLRSSPNDAAFACLVLLRRG